MAWQLLFSFILKKELKYKFTMLALKTPWLYQVGIYDLYQRPVLGKKMRLPPVARSVTMGKLPGILLRICGSSKVVLGFTALAILWVIYNSIIPQRYSFMPSVFLLVTVILSSIDVVLAFLNLISNIPHRFRDPVEPSLVLSQVSDIEHPPAIHNNIATKGKSYTICFIII